MVEIDHTEFCGAAGRAQLVEEMDVGVVVFLPLTRSVVFVEDRFNGADRLAGTTIDAFVRLDVEHPLALVNTVDGAFVHTGAVLQVHTRLSDDVRHERPPLKMY